MGYHTDFDGGLEIKPPLTAEQVAILAKWSNGDDTPEDSPGSYCPWVGSDDGAWIQWDEQEKPDDPEDWMAYICEHFLADGQLANGLIDASGEDPDDRWQLRVTDSRVEVIPGHVVFEKPGIYTVALLHTYELGPDVVKVKARDTLHAAAMALAAVVYADEPEEVVNDDGNAEEAAGWIVVAIFEGDCVEAKYPTPR